MEFNWTTIAWIAGLLFVYIFGLVEGRGQGYKKRKAEEQEEKRSQPAPPPETITVDDPGLLRIKNENGSFTLDLDGARVNPMSLSSGQKKRLIDILSIVRPWLEGRTPAAPAPSGVPSSPSGRVPAVDPAQRKSASVPPASPPAAASPLPPTAKPATIAKEDRPVAPSNSIVTQIDSVLQAHLAGTPLEERGIFLTESPDGGVAVYVGLTRYNGIDEVPELEIKAAIRAAIAEWEDKYTPGL